MALDGTECPVQIPTEFLIQKHYYSGKKKKHTIKYEVAVQLDNGRILWVGGAVPGSVHDVTMARTLGIFNHLVPGELIMGDKGYYGDEHFITPFKQPQTVQEAQWNSCINSVREIAEHTYCRIKTFNFTQQKWRHDLELHPIAFKTLCHMLNIDLFFNPVHK